MKDRLEQELFEMAGQERMILPVTLQKKIDDILVSLPKRRKYRMTWRKAIVLAAALTAMLSITVTAAVSAWRQRMEAMNEKEMEAYFMQIYRNAIGTDNYNRPYQESERERMGELRKSYEETGLFPRGVLTMLSEPEAYRGKGVGFYGKTATFFFPEKEMSDEELLQIIDFQHKRDYSLQAMNEKMAAGEVEQPTQTVNKEKEREIEPTDEAILQSEAIWNPEQELTIPYTGDLEIRTIAAGQDCIFLTGWNAIHKMEIGSGGSELFFDDFDVETDVSVLYQDKKGDIYLVLLERAQNGGGVLTVAGEGYKTSLWILSAEGKIKKKVDLSPYYDEIGGRVSRMAVDDAGYIYLRGMFSDRLVSIFDSDGNYVKAIVSDQYQSHLAGGLGVGRDGRVYTQIEARGGWAEGRRMGIASIDPEKGCLEDIYENIVPEDTIMLDIIAPGSDTDFVFWGYSGIFTYNLGEESAVNVLPAYEAPCQWEGCLYCVLPDGRIVFGDSTGWRMDGEKAYRVPDKTYFYYKTGLRKK
ncbi:MAG: hypothetical protein NC341_03645 [Blautia sp.]|nr:hypothetical protein [Blautia sp.]MCM1200691.1 hypothetical protein [Bacteroides fragilis]